MRNSEKYEQIISLYLSEQSNKHSLFIVCFTGNRSYRSSLFYSRYNKTLMLPKYFYSKYIYLYIIRNTLVCLLD